MQLGQQRRGIHYGNHGAAGGGRFPGEERPVSHHAGNGAANLRIAELGLGAEVLALGGGELSFRALEGGLVADLLHRFEMLFGYFMSSLGLHQRCFGGIQVAARDRSFREELGTAVHNALRQVQVGGCLGEVQLCLYRVFRYGGPGGNVVSTLGCVVGALVVERGGLEIAVLERGQKLTSFDVRTALDIELLYRRRDLGRNGGLGQWRQRGVRGDLLGDFAPFRMLGLHVDRSGRGLRGLAAGE